MTDLNLQLTPAIALHAPENTTLTSGSRRQQLKSSYLSSPAKALLAMAREHDLLESKEDLFISLKTMLVAALAHHNDYQVKTGVSSRKC